MLSQERNRMLTEVGRDKPMGDLLRCYWHPIAAVSEFEGRATKAVRLLGEDLVLYKDLEGKFGLLDRQCAHRNADLSYGYVEQDGLRCNYHGWLFDRTGQCQHQPFEEVVDPKAKLRCRTKIKSYPVEAKAGLLWAYMGKAPAPLIPDYEPFNWDNGFVQIVFSELPCNWFQCQENSIDPVHFEWMHNNWTQRMRGEDGPYSPTHLRIAFDEFEHGFIYRRERADEPNANQMWDVGRVVLWPHGFYLGHHFEWRVPIDDGHTLSVIWSFCRVPTECEPYRQGSIPSWVGPIKDENGRWIASHVTNQDFVAWVGQGQITDRSRESLGSSDRGVALMRKRFFEEMEAVKRGHDPKAVLRDPEQNVDIALPSIVREAMRDGLPRDELAKHPLLGPFLHDFILQAGQPDAVRAAYEEAIGQKVQGGKLFAVHGGGRR